VAKQSIYTVGGTVQASGGLYLPRKVDEELLALCRAGTFAYVLTSRQMGKSSLMVRTADRLTEGGIHAVIIDLNQLGIQLTAAEWYLGLLTIIADSLMPETDVMNWWQAHAHLGVTQRLTRFFQEIRHYRE
jgi:AAA-like domain